MDGMRLGFAPGVFDIVVSSFALFHFSDPTGALEGVRHVMRPGGAIALAVWGTGQVFPAQDAWNDELDAAGVPEDPAASGPPDGQEIVNSPDKMHAVLDPAGFVDVRAESVVWRQPWDAESFLDWRVRLGPGHRRLALLDPATRETVLARVRERVSALPPDELVDRDEVVLASGRAPA